MLVGRQALDVIDLDPDCGVHCIIDLDSEPDEPKSKALLLSPAVLAVEYHDTPCMSPPLFGGLVPDKAASNSQLSSGTNAVFTACHTTWPQSAATRSRTEPAALSGAHSSKMVDRKLQRAEVSPGLLLSRHCPKVVHDPFAQALARLRLQHLHPWQRGILEAWRAGKDALVLSGTGSGKSLCFQLPALVEDRSVVVVISPLISLMRDQVASMAERGIAACFIGSAQTDPTIEQRALGGEFPLVYMCPETVGRLLGRLLALSSQGRIRLFAIDEAHCISRWGHDFRRSYLALGSLRRHFPSVPLMALTATATERVREEIISSLGLHQPYTCINSFYRTNLAYSVRHSLCLRENWEEDLGALFPVRSRSASSGTTTGAGPQSASVGHRSTEPCTLVYTPSRREAEGIAAWLVRRGASAAPYHAKLPRAHLDDVHMRFLQGALACIVATIAFGMGINRGDVRRVVHYGYPQSLEALHQETGRAGRDGCPSECILFANLQVPPKLLPSKRDRETTQICLAMLNSLYAYAISESGCRVRVLLNYFNETKGSSWRCGACDLCGAGSTRAVATDINQDCFRLLEGVQQVARLRCALGRGLEQFGYVVHALVGRAPREAKGDSIGVDSLPCFGAGSARPPKFWRALAQMLLQAGLLHATGAGRAGHGQVAAPATFLHCPELTELGRVAFESLQRGEHVPLISSLEMNADVAAILGGEANDKPAKPAGRTASGAQACNGRREGWFGQERAASSLLWGPGQRLGSGGKSAVAGGRATRRPSRIRGDATTLSKAHKQFRRNKWQTTSGGVRSVADQQVFGSAVSSGRGRSAAWQATRIRGTKRRRLRA